VGDEDGGPAVDTQQEALMAAALPVVGEQLRDSAAPLDDGAACVPAKGRRDAVSPRRRS